MNLETETTIMIALLPFLAVWALLDLSRRIQRRREEWVARQIALTDAIHRELGAVAAPDVTRSLTGTWTVSMRLPLHRDGQPFATVRVGISGWTYPPWRGVFYPKGMRSADYLAFYAEHFHTVEVDSTFYGCPTARTVNNWGARTPEGFIFSVKVPHGDSGGW